ncbi:MAG: hypothetical protein IPJ16_13675 [Bacteroidales bacterium]|nr:hypothetical protein [Bacteroidales bacterium]
MRKNFTTNLSAGRQSTQRYIFHSGPVPENYVTNDRIFKVINYPDMHW